jgi:hypothetical protein
MGVPNNLPAELVALRDAAVAHAISGFPLPEDIGKLASWFDGDCKWNHKLVAVHLGNLARDFNDNQARAEGDFLEDDLLTDADRVKVARAMVEKSMFDPYASEFYVGFNLTSDSGDSATIWFSIPGYGLDGYAFAGIYMDKEECKKDLRSMGYLVEPNPEDVPEKDILALWRHK